MIDLVDSIPEHEVQCPKKAEKIMVLDKHKEVSAKKHERLRHGKDE